MHMTQDESLNSSDTEAAEGEKEAKEGKEVPEIVVEESEDGSFNLVANKAEKRRLRKPWKLLVFVKLLGRNIGYEILKKRLDAMWDQEGLISLIDIGNGYFLVRFQSPADLNFGLTAGHWFIFDHYLTVRQWEPDFDPYENPISKLAVWARLLGLPMDYYDRKYIQTIGNCMGRTLQVDINTASHQRGKFTRIYVEINLEKPLASSYSIEGKKYMIEYEGLHLICFGCGQYGHSKENCPSKPQKNTDQEKESGEGQHEEGDENSEKEMVVLPNHSQPLKKRTDMVPGCWCKNQEDLVGIPSRDSCHSFKIRGLVPGRVHHVLRS